MIGYGRRPQLWGLFGLKLVGLRGVEADSDVSDVQLFWFQALEQSAARCPSLWTSSWTRAGSGRGQEFGTGVGPKVRTEGCQKCVGSDLGPLVPDIAHIGTCMILQGGPCGGA